MGGRAVVVRGEICGWVRRMRQVRRMGEVSVCGLDNIARACICIFTYLNAESDEAFSYEKRDLLSFPLTWTVSRTK